MSKFPRVVPISTRAQKRANILQGNLHLRRTRSASPWKQARSRRRVQLKLQRTAGEKDLGKEEKLKLLHPCRVQLKLQRTVREKDLGKEEERTPEEKRTSEKNWSIRIDFAKN